jgi:hypothetical protein
VGAKDGFYECEDAYAYLDYDMDDDIADGTDVVVTTTGG